MKSPISINIDINKNINIFFFFHLPLKKLETFFMLFEPTIKVSLDSFIPFWSDALFYISTEVKLILWQTDNHALTQLALDKMHKLLLDKNPSQTHNMANFVTVGNLKSIF